MFAWPRSQFVVAALALAAVVALGARELRRPAAPPPAAPAVRLTAGAGRALTVHVAGAVRRPGVYRLRQGARVEDAVARAGGPARRADLAALNLAARLEDGRQVLVPRRGAAAAPAPAAASAPAAGPVSLGTATAEQLDALDGVGPETARKILEYRREHGGFGSVEELDRVPGIGPGRLAALRGKVQP